MDVLSIIRKVKQIEVRSKLLSNQQIAGAYHTAFKGRGMQFSEVREYTYGDDIRHIDWSVSARMQHPYVKLFHEEREQTIFFMIDISPSVLTSIAHTDRRELIAEIVATLAFSANRNQDNVGLVLFDGKVRTVLPPKKGHQNILQIIRSIMTAESSVEGEVNLEEVVRHFKKIYKRNAVVFLFSDFLMDEYKNALRLLGNRNDLIGVKIKDPLDDHLPDLGLIQVVDVETKRMEWVDTSSKSYRKWYSEQANYRKKYFLNAFAEVNASTIELVDQEDYIQALQKFFYQRVKRG